MKGKRVDELHTIKEERTPNASAMQTLTLFANLLSKKTVHSNKYFPFTKHLSNYSSPLPLSPPPYLGSPLSSSLGAMIGG